MHERTPRFVVPAKPFVYQAFHHLIGAPIWLKRFTNEVIRPRPPEAVENSSKDREPSDDHLRRRGN